MKDLLYRSVLLLIAVASCYEMFSYEGGIFKTVKDRDVIWYTSIIFAFFLIISVLKNTVVQFALSVPVCAVLLFMYGYGFLFVPILLTPCFFFSAARQDKTSIIIFIIGAVLNIAALIYGVIKAIAGITNIEIQSDAPLALSSGINTFTILLILFVFFFVFCLLKSFSFTSKKAVGDKPLHKKAKKKEDKQKTVLSEKYNTFYLLVTANAFFTALYIIFFNNDSLSAAVLLVWCAVLFILYFGNDPVLCSVFKKNQL